MTSNQSNIPGNDALSPASVSPWITIMHGGMKSYRMKKYLAIVTALLSLTLFSFKPVYSIDEVLSALRSGNAAQLAKYFDSRVDISLPNKSDNFSKNQAEMILKDFFASNEVKNFQVKHKGENNGSQFCIGLLRFPVCS